MPLASITVQFVVQWQGMRQASCERASWRVGTHLNPASKSAMLPALVCLQATIS